MLVKDGLRIRGIERSDLATIMSWNNQESRGEFQEFHIRSMESLTMQYQKDAYNSENSKLFMIETTEGEKIGLVYLHFKREGLVNIGMGLCDTGSRNTGRGTLAASMIVEYLFANYPLARIEAETDIDNISAQRVLEKVGFAREGVLRNFRFHHGEWRDFVSYSILRGELKPIK